MLETSHATVMHGPFRSMRIAENTSWRDGDLLPKLLGCYEESCLSALMQLRDQRFECVVNVGCAEGFFAVGTALLLEPHKVIAVDVDAAALEATKANAELNGVGERFEMRRGIDAHGLAGIARQHPRSLVISDCEGFEADLFSESVLPELIRCTCLIECHDFLGRDMVSELSSRFDRSHAIRVLEEGPRNPNQYEVLRNLSSLDRWLAVTEFRPQAMRWILAVPST